MPGGALFEVVLVILFVFVTMSAIVSSAQELLFQAIGWRTRKLRKTVEKMVTDKDYKKEISRRLYMHPLITGEEGSKKHITYIEPSSFAQALAHAVQPAGSRADPMDDLPNSIDSLRDGDLKRRLQMVLPASAAINSREEIQGAVTAWFDTMARKTSESYRADAKAASYLIAAVVTVGLNVSPVEIIQRLSQDDALRTTFASAVPDLAPMLYNPGQGIPVSPPAAGAVEDAASQPQGASSQINAGTAELNPEDLKKMLSFYQCAESRLSLPIGWAWMANAADSLKQTQATASKLGYGDQAACQKAIADARSGGASPALVKGLAQLNLSSTSFKREYGPSFETDSPLMIFGGWLIMVIAAGQGAPFWFSLLQKFVRR
jgi:hypothetical protein